MMEVADYYVEYYEELDKRLECFISDWGTDYEVKLDKHNVTEPLKTFLFYRLSMERDYYNQCRLKGMSIDEAMERVDAFMKMFNEESSGENQEEKRADMKAHPWYELLSEYKGVLIVYLFNARQLQYLTPLLLELNHPVLLLSEYDIPEETELPEYVTALPIEFSNENTLTDKEFKLHFPLVFHYANTFDILFQIIQPCGVICLEGCHFQEQLLAVVAESYDIPSYGIQQGWPSMMRTGFRRLPFRYFLTWGEQFSSLWAKYNPFPKFVPTGYMYEIAGEVNGEKQCVSFFLQSPCFLSDRIYFDAMLELISDSANTFPEVTFLVREHPEYRLEELIVEKWKELDNVEVVSDCRLQDVYARAKIVVSHFSSSLMEGMLYGCIPLVYDPTANSHYYPDVEKEGLGRISKSAEEFQTCLKELLTERKQPIPFDKKNQWFTSTGDVTIKSMVTFLKDSWRYE